MDMKIFESTVFETVPFKKKSGEDIEIRALRKPKELVDALTGCKDVTYINNDPYFVTSNLSSTHGFVFECPVEFALMLNNYFINEASDLALQWRLIPQFFRQSGHTVIIFVLLNRHSELEELWKNITPEELGDELLRLAGGIRNVDARYRAHDLAVKVAGNVSRKSAASTAPAEPAASKANDDAALDPM